MMARRDHNRLNQRDHMRRVGFEDIAGRVVPDLGWKWWRAGRRVPVERAVTKASMRAEADAAVAEWRATQTSSAPGRRTP